MKNYAAENRAAATGLRARRTLTPRCSMKALVLAAALSSACVRQWSPANTAAEATFVTLVAVDWGQTKKITRDCAESNPILGRCGQRFPVDVWMPLVVAAHLAASLLLPPDARAWMQGVTAGAEGAAVWINLRGGYTP